MKELQMIGEFATPDRWKDGILLSERAISTYRLSTSVSAMLFVPSQNVLSDWYRTVIQFGDGPVS